MGNEQSIYIHLDQMDGETASAKHYKITFKSETYSKCNFFKKVTYDITYYVEFPWVSKSSQFYVYFRKRSWTVVNFWYYPYYEYDVIEKVYCFYSVLRLDEPLVLGFTTRGDKTKYYRYMDLDFKSSTGLPLGGFGEGDVVKNLWQENEKLNKKFTLRVGSRENININGIPGDDGPKDISANFQKVFRKANTDSDFYGNPKGPWELYSGKLFTLNPSKNKIKDEVIKPLDGLKFYGVYVYYTFKDNIALLIELVKDFNDTIFLARRDEDGDCWEKIDYNKTTETELDNLLQNIENELRNSRSNNRGGACKNIEYTDHGNAVLKNCEQKEILSTKLKETSPGKSPGHSLPVSPKKSEVHHQPHQESRPQSSSQRLQPPPGPAGKDAGKQPEQIHGKKPGAGDVGSGRLQVEIKATVISREDGSRTVVKTPPTSTTISHTKTDSARPIATKTEPDKPSITKGDSPKKEAAKPTATKTEAAKPTATKAEATPKKPVESERPPVPDRPVEGSTSQETSHLSTSSSKTTYNTEASKPVGFESTTAKPGETSSARTSLKEPSSQESLQVGGSLISGGTTPNISGQSYGHPRDGPTPSKQIPPVTSSSFHTTSSTSDISGATPGPQDSLSSQGPKGDKGDSGSGKKKQQKKKEKDKKKKNKQDSPKPVDSFQTQIQAKSGPLLNELYPDGAASSDVHGTRVNQAQVPQSQTLGNFYPDGSDDLGGLISSGEFQRQVMYEGGSEDDDQSSFQDLRTGTGEQSDSSESNDSSSEAIKGSVGGVLTTAAVGGGATGVAYTVFPEWFIPMIKALV